MTLKTRCLLLTILCISCAVQKRHYRKGFYVDVPSPGRKTIITTVEKRLSTINRQFTGPGFDMQQDQCKNTLRPDADSIRNRCDTVVLRTGKRVVARIAEINPGNVVLRGCSDDSLNTLVLQKDAVLQLTFSNGVTETFATPATEPEYIPPAPKMSYWLSGVSLALALTSLFIPLTLMPVFIGVTAVAVLTAAYSITHINERQDRMKGKGMAFAALIISFIYIAAVVLFVPRS